MNQTAFFLVLASVVLHALWHFLSKSQEPRLGFFMVLSFSLFSVMLPFLLFSGVDPARFPPRLWLCILCGGMSGALYVVGLSCAYRHADISLAYPVSRALPVLLTAGLTALLGTGRPLAAAALGGMALVFAGCLLLPLPSWRRIPWKAYCNKGMLGILVAAVGTTLYTVADGEGVRLITGVAPGRISAAGTYSCLREFTLLCCVSVTALCWPRERRALSMDLLRHPHPYLAGVFAGAAYLLVLIAMGHVANVSLIQAFRQMSLPVGFLLGVCVLHEKITAGKVAAVALVLAGLALVYLG